MAGLKKTLKKVVGRNVKDLKDTATLKNPFATIDPIGHAMDTADDATEAFTPEIPELPEETIIPIPDERRASLEARRRRAKKASTGRSSTILTQGLGG